MARTGRPKIEIDRDLFEAYCEAMCTEVEIAGFFKCSVDTIERWCKRTYKETFAEAYKKLSAKGLISLRRAQFRKAIEDGNTTMQIWLGKQYLGQSESPSTSTDTEDADSYFDDAGI